MGIVSRIAAIIEHEGISTRAFENSIGASTGLIGKAIRNSTDIQAKWLESILRHYPYYSAEWLVTGIGDMIKDNRPSIEDNYTHAETQGNSLATVYKDLLAKKECELYEKIEENGRLKEMIRQKDEQIVQLSSSLPPHIPTESEDQSSFILPKIRTPYTEEYTLK